MTVFHENSVNLPSMNVIWVYGLAHFGKSLFWNASILLFAFFLTEIVLMAPEQMGLVLGLSIVVNAFFDLGVGFYLGKVVRNQRAAGKWQFFGSLLAAIAFMAFSMTALLPENYRLPYALATVLLFRIGYSFYDVPQNAYMAFATKTDAMRSQFAATRYIAAGASLICLTLIFGPIIREIDPKEQAILFAMVSIGLAVVSISCSLTLMLVTTRRQKQDAVYNNESNSLVKPIGLFSGDNVTLYCLLLISIFCLSLVSNAFSKLEAYFTAYGIADVLAAAYFMTSVATGKVLFQLFWMKSGAYLGLYKNLQVSSVLLACSCVLFFFFAASGSYITLIVAFLYGGMWGGVAMSLWGLLAKASSTAPSQTTKRYGAFTFCSKMGNALCMFALGHVLASFDYSSANGSKGLTAIMSITPMLGALLLFIMISYLIFVNKKMK